MTGKESSTRPADLEPSAAVITFNDVTARVFPLRASLTKLQDFCDAYLNLSPDSWFRPAAPGVMLMAMNYPGMSDSAINMGWVSQHEFMFAVTLEWFERDEHGDFQFQDWVVVSPYIFVDDEFSAIGGREMGWPKVLARLQPEINPWMQDPRLARRLLRLETQMFSRLYAGEPLQNRTLLEVYQYESNTSLQFPPNPSALFGPVVSGLNGVYYTAGSFASFLGEALGERLGIPAFRHKAEASVPRLLHRAGQYLAGGRPLTAVTLAQFRASQANGACFQALVLSQMALARFHAGGPLGDAAVLRGDPSGGLRVRVHDHNAFPIVDSLGLDHRLVSSSNGEGKVTELIPFAPFWMALDLRYVVGGRIAYRAPGMAGWSSEKARPTLFVDDRLGCDNKTVLQTGGPDEVVTVPKDDIVPYNTTLGPLSSPIGGPFEFFGLETKVLPIAIDWRKALECAKDACFFLRNLPVLRKYGCAHTKTPLDLKSVSARPYPYFKYGDHAQPATLAFITVNHNEAMSSAANNVGWWATNSVQIALLLRLEFEHEDGTTFEKFFVYPVYDFADSPLSAMTGHEVRGLPTSLARIEGGRDPWLEKPFAPRKVLEVKAKVFPALNQGQTVSEKTLLAFHQTEGTNLGAEAIHENAVTRDLLDHFKGRLRLDYLAYKNYVSAENPAASNYAGFVAWHSLIGEFGEPEEGSKGFEVDALPDVEVSILKQPTYDIADKLGVFVDHQKLGVDKGDVYAVAKTYEPFRIHGDTRWSLPYDLFWQVVHPSPIYVREGSYDYLVDDPVEPGTQWLAELLHAMGRVETEKPPYETLDQPRATPEPGRAKRRRGNA